MNKNGVLGKLVGAMVGFLRPARGNSSSTDLFQLAGRKSGDMRPGPWLKNAPTNGGRVYTGVTRDGFVHLPSGVVYDMRHDGWRRVRASGRAS